MPSGDDFRKFALALPEAVEKETWGHPTFRVRDKMFAALSDDGTSGSAKATKDEQAALIAADPETFSRPAYVGQHGWVGIDVTRVDPDELRDLIVEAWRLTAPKRLVKAYDSAE